LSLVKNRPTQQKVPTEPTPTLQREAIEQPQSIRIEALAIRGEQALDAKLVLRVGFGIQMEDGRRLVDDPRIVAADEVREIVIL